MRHINRSEISTNRYHLPQLYELTQQFEQQQKQQAPTGSVLKMSNKQHFTRILHQTFRSLYLHQPNTTASVARAGRIFSKPTSSFSTLHQKNLHISSPLFRKPLLLFRRGRRPYSATPPPPPPPQQQQSLSLSARFRKLSREYGWSALGVYLLLSALDFPFCFLAVRLLGTDRIGHWEHVVLDWFWRVVPYPFPPGEKGGGQGLKKNVGDDGLVVVVGEEGGLLQSIGGGIDHGVEEAEKMNTGENASIWTQLALAYAIHKSFIFIRIPLTAAVTPKVVKVLRGWGWDIGKRRPKRSS